MAHVFPFHSSASAPESLWPTATQVVADGHETALRLATALGRLPQWRIWRGHTTGDYWAMPPRNHPTVRQLISASNIGELAHRLAQAEGQHGL